MVDAWKMALEVLVYGRPSPRRSVDARRVAERARILARVLTVGELRRHYAYVCMTPSYTNLRDVPEHGEMLSPRQIEDAAFGLRYLQLVNGSRIDVQPDRLSPWMLAVAG